MPSLIIFNMAVAGTALAHLFDSRRVMGTDFKTVKLETLEDMTIPIWFNPDAYDAVSGERL